MENIKTNQVLDAKGLACPMPIVKTKKAINGLEAGQVIEVQATDKGSTADIEAWAKSSGHQYLGTKENGDVLKHYLRKSSDEETTEKKHPHTVTNEELTEKLSTEEDIVVLDVREEAEYAFGHIPGAQSIPLGELEERQQELDKDKNIYVVCRTGSRSDLASQKLSENGFANVVNVVPGMSEWNGETE
ncbi:sulfurtransferase TusA family protein [Gracilibacillus kekensis]|uniref:Rhodanese-related sulfurtransferase n=1 Tax=Gracilibacillus kekensis TaxID=1027249 RepID=A0A1M7KKM3_9BACI|nr:sulfurtransferase TusA family protein [Gracilibacillus kekensis]SHM65949.1 Rhodanese-related sulfurtransferase [Gracilibacillus kekensis]